MDILECLEDKYLGCRCSTEDPCPLWWECPTRDAATTVIPREQEQVEG